MQDQYNRIIDYARFSLTDSCNESCLYCRSKGDSTCSASMKTEDWVQLARILASLGIKKIKLTGGEPLLYPDVENLVRQLYKVEGIEQVTLTTNGLLAADHLAGLKAAGLNDITFSLDALDPALYKRMTGADGLYTVLGSLSLAMGLGMNVKINCVALSMNESQWVKIACLAKDHPIAVRFIEMMPIGLGQSFQRISQQQVREKLEETFGPMKPVSEKLGNGPAWYEKPEEFYGSIGWISPFGHEFCESCSRIRFSSTGQFQGCLNSAPTDSLQKLLREDPDQAREIIARLIYEKPARHEFEKKNQKRRMHAIGG